MSYRTSRAFERQPSSLPFALEWKGKHEPDSHWSVMAFFDGLALTVWLAGQMRHINKRFDYRVRG